MSVNTRPDRSSLERAFSDGDESWGGIAYHTFSQQGTWQATLTVYSDGCGVIRTEFARDPQNLSWSVKDAGGFQVLQRNAEGETRYRYFRSGHYTVTLTGFDGQKYAPASNTVSISC